MAIQLELAPKTKRLAGERGCEPTVLPEIDRGQATRLAQLAKVLGDPTRLQLVDVLRRHAGQVCVCELQPLFDITQSTLSEHLKKLRDAGVVGVERRGLWAYYYVISEALEELSTWLKMTEADVRDRYATAVTIARAASAGPVTGCSSDTSSCCGSSVALTDESGAQALGDALCGEVCGQSYYSRGGRALGVVRIDVEEVGAP